MDELKMIVINEEGVFCHIFALDEDGIEDFIGIMESGIIWCKNFKYSKYGTDGIRLKVFI